MTVLSAYPHMAFASDLSDAWLNNESRLVVESPEKVKTSTDVGDVSVDLIVEPVASDSDASYGDSSQDSLFSSCSQGQIEDTADVPTDKRNGPRSVRSPARPKRKPRIAFRPAPSTRFDLSFLSEDTYTCDTLFQDNERIDRDNLSFLHHVFAHCKRIIFITGAGISVSAGIPDFRSASGLFRSVKGEFGLKTSGKEMFDSSVYASETGTSNFHSMVKDLYSLCQRSSPTRFHHFMNEIAGESRLARLYTQNIDCLETRLPHLQTEVPLGRAAPYPRTVQLHGTVQYMTCTKCHWNTQLDPELLRDAAQPPLCPKCEETEEIREIAGKRAQGVGVLRPRIVLYNEFHPDGEVIGGISAEDLLRKPDGLVVVGTTLKIPGVRRLVKELSAAVRANNGGVVWVNKDDMKDKALEGCFDLIVKGDCQVVPLLMRDYEEDKQMRKKAERKARRAEAKARSAKSDVGNGGNGGDGENVGSVGTVRNVRNVFEVPRLKCEVSEVVGPQMRVNPESDDGDVSTGSLSSVDSDPETSFALRFPHLANITAHKAVRISVPSRRKQVALDVLPGVSQRDLDIKRRAEEAEMGFTSGKDSKKVRLGQKDGLTEGEQRLSEILQKFHS